MLVLSPWLRRLFLQDISTQDASSVGVVIRIPGFCRSGPSSVGRSPSQRVCSAPAKEDLSSLGEGMKHILVTGATGKVGAYFCHQVLHSDSHQDVTIRALCHNRVPQSHKRLEIVKGNISDRDMVRAAMKGITHVVHCATCKETADDVMDVTIKGLFWLLEECRASNAFQRIILIGGDAAMGHFFYPHPVPVTEHQKHTAYPGCYALSKVLEEVMLEQYYIQYNLSGCCLRAPWIMEKDDFKHTLSFGDDVFGGPRWRDLVGTQRADEYIKANAVPLMLDPDGQPVKRNFVHLSDLVESMIIALPSQSVSTDFQHLHGRAGGL
jgi:UDP-glucose 4-epimerase